MAGVMRVATFYGLTGILVTSSVIISPAGTSSVGQSVAGDFTITNSSSQAVTLDKLVLGGRFNSQNPCVDACPDFVPVISNITLAAGESYSYHGTKQLMAA